MYPWSEMPSPPLTPEEYLDIEHRAETGFAEIEPDETEDDFANEVALTRQNTALRALLAERSKEPGKYSLEQVREKLGLTPSSE